MLYIDKIRVAVAGVSLTYPLPIPNRNRIARQAALPQIPLSDMLQSDFLPNAPTFDGISDKFDMLYASELNPANFTVDMWAMVEGGTGYQSIVASVAGSPLEGRKGYLFCLTPARQLQFWLGTGEPKAFWRVVNGPQVRQGVWTHLAGTYDRRARTMTFYVNGQEVGRHSNVLYQPNDCNATHVGVGATEQLGASPCFFCGKIAEVHVWDRVLSPDEIQSLSSRQSLEIQQEEGFADEFGGFSPGQSFNNLQQPSFPEEFGGFSPRQSFENLQQQRSFPEEIQAYSPGQLFAVQQRSFSEISLESTSVWDSDDNIPQLEQMTENPGSDSFWQNAEPTTFVRAISSQQIVEQPLARSPIVEQPLARKQPDTVNPSSSTSFITSNPSTSIAEPHTVLWQIGKPSQAGKAVPTGPWRLVYDYAIATDSDPINHPMIPSSVVPPCASQIPNSTSQLNIHFAIAQDYPEGQLILYYDRYGSREDTIYLDGELIETTPGADFGNLKQSQISLGFVSKGHHTLSITTANTADAAHLIDYLQLQSLNPMLYDRTFLQGNPPSDRPQTENYPQTFQSATAQTPVEASPFAGLNPPIDLPHQPQSATAQTPVEASPFPWLNPPIGLPNQSPQPSDRAFGPVGEVAAPAANSNNPLGQAIGLLEGLNGQSGGLLEQLQGVRGMLGQGTGLMEQLQGAGGAIGAVSNILGQLPGVGGAIDAMGNMLGQLPGGGASLAQPGGSGAQDGAIDSGGVSDRSRTDEQLISSALSASTIVHLAQLISQINGLMVEMSQVLHQLAMVTQSSGAANLSPQQLAQLQALTQQVRGANLSPQQFPQPQALTPPTPNAANLSPQQFPQPQALTPPTPSTANLSPQQLAQLQALTQHIPGAANLSPHQLAQLLALIQQIPGAANLSPQQLAQLYRELQSGV